jgi:hypothetical protein
LSFLVRYDGKWGIEGGRPARTQTIQISPSSLSSPSYNKKGRFPSLPFSFAIGIISYLLAVLIMHYLRLYQSDSIMQFFAHLLFLTTRPPRYYAKICVKSALTQIILCLGEPFPLRAFVRYKCVVRILV